LSPVQITVAETIAQLELGVGTRRSLRIGVLCARCNPDPALAPLLQHLIQPHLRDLGKEAARVAAQEVLEAAGSSVALMRSQIASCSS
jgi:hypothetical protein